MLTLMSVVCATSAEAASPKARLGTLCATVGTGGGQCGSAIRGLAVNATGAGGAPAGSVYVIDGSNQRIQQFSATGTFIRAFGKGVDQTTGGDVCTAASGDVCKAGVAGAGAGSLNLPYGIAVDQTTGAVYVTEQTSVRVDVFSATGVFEGAIGWNVNSTAPAEAVQFCTAVTGCKAGVVGGAAGQLSSLKLSGVTVDPRNGNVNVADLGNLRLAEYDVLTNPGGEVTGATFVRAIGWGVDLTTPAEQLQVCTVLTGCKTGTSGWGNGQFFKEGTNGTPGPIAVDSNGYIYAASPKFGGSCSVTEPCRVQKFNPDGTFKENFGPSSGECQLTYTSGTATLEEAFDVAVYPDVAAHDNRVYVAKKVSATEYRVYEFDENGGSCVVSPSGSPLVGTATIIIHGLAAGVESRVYVTNGVTQVAMLGEAPPPVVAMTEVKSVSAGGATFVGQVTPPAQIEGQTFQPKWHFQYSTDQSNWTTVPVPDRTVTSGPGVPEVVEEAVSGLVPNTHYFVRLCGTTGPTVCSSPPLAFNTKSVGPTVTPFSFEVTQNGATLGAEINPNNLAAKYHVEWATEAEWAQSPGVYGHRLPAQDRQIGSGSENVIAYEQLAGLLPASVYHFRVVATNSAGTTNSLDQLLETLNSCGMTDGRCFELVSRADKGPLASPGMKMPSGAQIEFQAAPTGSALAYTVVSGYPEATTGDAALYLARRDSAGWESQQVTPPTLDPPVLGGSWGQNTAVKILSSDLGCAVVASVSPLSAGAPPTVVAAGGANLYRRDDASGSYQLITSLPPVNPGVADGAILNAPEYQINGMSPDCERITFRTFYRYPGIPSVGSAKSQLYEWDHGAIRNVAIVPGTGGSAEPVPAESIPGAMESAPLAVFPSEKGATDYWRAVSADGSRSIFTAISRFGGDTGKRAIFLRDANVPAVLAGTAPATDVSQSETATANDGNSRYWTASADGKRILFTARYGLAATGSSTGATSCANVPFGGASQGSGAGCDLYEYDLEKPAGARLTDLSPDVADAAGAGVVGVLDASEDGSYVYFAARGRLGGAGRTEAENLGLGTYNLYLAHAGAIQLVGPLGEPEVIGGAARTMISNATGVEWTSRATPSGSRFVFESSLGTPGGVAMAYLFSAADGNTVCVSCRHDGKSPFSAHKLNPLIGVSVMNQTSKIGRPTILTESGRLYFYSFDPLASGAVEGERSLYQWEHGQVSLIAGEPASVPRGNGNPSESFFGGVSADGGDVYFTTPLGLIGGDRDGRWDVYDARVGGGFPETAPPPPPCDATVEGACNAGAGNSAAATAAPATSTFTGPSNAPAETQKPKQHKKKHKKKKHKKAGKAGRANGERRAAR